MSADHPDQVRWFDAFGPCEGCGKPATGRLMGPRNDNYGAYCLRCADRRLAKAKKEREQYAKTHKEEPAYDPL